MMPFAGQLACAVILLSVLSAEASWRNWIPSWGKCPDLKAKQGFYTDIDKFMKTWYVQSTSNTDFLQDHTRCMSVNYRFNRFNGVIYVVGKQYKEGDGWQSLEAKATPHDSSRNEAKFTLAFSLPVYGKVSGTYTILDTDYDNFSVAHGCGSIFHFFHYESSWLMSRKRNLSEKEKSEFYKRTSTVLKMYEGLGEFHEVDQVKC